MAAEASESSVPLSAICNFWSDFDLEGRRDRLDGAALEIAQFQETSLQRRKDLAGCTKKFKSSVSEESKQAVALLLRKYQEEVDRLTKRAKHGESAFLELYQKLYEAPDPSTALALAVEQASQTTSLEARNQKLANELADYQAEAKSIKKQDLTLRRLEDKVKTLEATLESKEVELENAKETAEAEVDAEVLNEMHEREQRLEQMLAEAQTSLDSMRHMHLASQDKLFEMQSKTEDSAANNMAELDISSQELERASKRVLALEQEKRMLLDQLEDVGPVAAQKDAAALHKTLLIVQDQLAAQKRATVSLQDELVQERSQHAEETATLHGRCGAIRKELEAQEAHTAALESERAVLPSTSTVEKLRRQVQSLQVMHYGSVDEAPAHSEQSLDRALLGKVRSLEHELTMQRLKANDAASIAEAAEARTVDLEREVQTHQETISRLEEDILATEQATPSGAAHEHSFSVGGNGTDNGGEDHSMLQVLCGQRDRLRAKVQQLQEDLTRCEANLASTQADAAAARAENVAMVERLRYVQSFSQKNVPRQCVDLEAGMAAEKKYSRVYEQGLDPFSEFKGKQRESLKSKMSAADRAIHSMGQLVVGSKWARLALFVYMAMVHLMVFGMLTRMAHSHDHTPCFMAQASTHPAIEVETQG